MPERETKIKKEIALDRNKFREDPIKELMRIRPHQRVEVTALSHVKTSRGRIFFLKRYEKYIETTVNQNELNMFGGPIKLAYDNIMAAVNMVYTRTKEWDKLFDNWEKSIKDAKIFNYLLK